MRKESTPSAVKLTAWGVTSATLTPVLTTVQLQADTTRSATHNIDGYSLWSGSLVGVPDQLTIDSEAQITGTIYRDDFRTVRREVDGGVPRPLATVSRGTVVP